MIDSRRVTSPRWILCAVVVAVIVGGSLGCARARAEGPDMIVLGMDGLDYGLVQELMEAGRLPNFARLADSGHFQPLETAATPQSPVAWSDFMTGLDAGGHGIFDFLHRDLDVENAPPFGMPRQATSKETPVTWDVQIGKWQIPLSGGDQILAREGTAFWELLADRGIDTTIVRMPANYPPIGKADRELSGMGTPDLRGTSGTFTFFTTDRRQFMKRDVTGGEVYPADIVDGVFHGSLTALEDNPLTEDEDPIYIDFTAYIDAESPVAKLDVAGEELILRQGEWSDWVPLSVEIIPYLQSVPGAVRFYLKSLHPDFELYVTPIQMDPADSSTPVAAPASFAQELAEAEGRFWTQEMPEDTKALDNGIFDIDDFIAQTDLVREETIRQYEHLLETWKGGFLFYYFGSTDQVAHELWGITMDPEHPRYDPEVHPAYADHIPSIYEEMDRIVGLTLERMDDDDTLVIMSDHGFASWRRSMHLNTWLLENGYLALREGTRLPIDSFFTGVDWRQTRAYSVGIAALYVNLRGREPQGIVAPGDREELLEQLERDLLAATDPATGEPLVTKVYIRERDFQDRGNLEEGPDIVVGFAKHVRGSGKSALGGLPVEFVTDNTEEWTGDHIMDHRTVPGVLFSNRPPAHEVVSLRDLASALLAQLGIDGFPSGSQTVTVNEDGTTPLPVAPGE